MWTSYYSTPLNYLCHQAANLKLSKGLYSWEGNRRLCWRHFFGSPSVPKTCIEYLAQVSFWYRVYMWGLCPLLNSMQ